jgi:hypothetical protein
MAFSYPLTISSTWVGFENFVLKQRQVTAMSQSPFTFKQQIIRHPGMAWAASLSIAQVNKELAMPWISFLGKLRGRYGTFLLTPPNGATARGVAGTAPGTPLVKGAGQIGDTLIFDGAGTSVTNYLRAGDYLQIGTGASSRLYMVMDDESSDGTGTITCQVWPDIVVAPADNAAIVVTSPKGAFRLASDEVAWSEDNTGKFKIAFDALGVV